MMSDQSLYRTDSPLIKHLAQTISLKASQIYNGLPLFILPDGADEIMSFEQDLLDTAPVELPLPFDDFLLDFPFGTTGLVSVLPGNGSMERGRLWVRVRRVSSVHADSATQIALSHLTAVPDPQLWILLEGWEEKTVSGSLAISPDHSLVSLHKPDIGNFIAYRHAYPNGECRDDRVWGSWCNIKLCQNQRVKAVRCAASELIHGTMCRLVVLSLVYITEGLGGLTTEVSWQPVVGAREEKTERLKPWIVPRRKTYITIDPAHARDYGHPSAIHVELPGHHGSPAPHPRRGHWRKLAVDGKTWVRPTWVGAKEWQYEGRTYKIRPRSVGEAP